MAKVTKISSRSIGQFGMMAVLAFGLAACSKACGNKQGTEPQAQSTTMATDAGGPPGGIAELKIEDLKVGSGATAKAGKKLTVHYTGTLLDGKKFDSSHDRNQPFTFTLGQGMVIQGWDKGLDGMKVGGKRKLTIPSNMAYGEHGAGNQIPPNSPLVFEVELLKVE